MYKLLHFSIVSVFLCTVVLAQDQRVVIEEKFSNNKLGWKDYDEGSSNMASITGGYYYFKIFKNIKPVVTLVPSKIDSLNENFSMEATLKLSGGVFSEAGFGFMVSSDAEGQKAATFLVKNNLFSKFGLIEKGKNAGTDDWKSARKVAANATIKLRLVKEYNCYSLYINNNLLQTSCNVPVAPKFVGFYVGAQQEVGVDELKVMAWPKMIPLADNAIQGRKKINLGPNINSDYNELSPVVSYDGKTLYFVRYDHPDNIKKEDDDIYVSFQDKNGNWSPAKNIGPPLNNKTYNAIKSISPDNQMVVLANCYKADGSPDGEGLSFSEWNGTSWNVPRRINITNFKNSNSAVDYFVTSDNKILLLAIDNGHTLGEKDLYISFLKKDGSFSEPQSMGNVINSAGDEFGMSLAADGRTLYFCSTGHETYGSADVFASKRIGTGWTTWSKPVNLGPEINSPGWDGAYRVSAKGDYAYLSSSSEKNPNTKDIYRIELGKEDKPDPVVMVSGVAYNKNTKQPISTKITYFDLRTNTEVGIAQSDPSNGFYKIILPGGTLYGFLAEKENFFSLSQNIVIDTLKEFTEVNRDIFLVPVKEGETYLLNNIFFETNKAELKPESANELDRLVTLLKENINMAIEISGHTDNQGSAEYNKTLSQNRVNSVVNYLIEKGIEASRLKGIGYGKIKPIASNDTEEGRAQNRRVEFTIKKK